MSFMNYYRYLRTPEFTGVQKKLKCIYILVLSRSFSNVTGPKTVEAVSLREYGQAALK